MELIEDWQAVAKKAWSFKYSILAALFGAFEVVVAIIQPDAIPNGIFAGIAGFVSLVAAGSRLMAQKEMTTTVVK